MMALNDAAFERSNGNQTSRIGLNVAVGNSSNIMAAWVLSPITVNQEVVFRTYTRPFPASTGLRQLTVMKEPVMLSCQLHRKHVERVQPAACERAIHSSKDLRWDSAC